MEITSEIGNRRTVIGVAGEGGLVAVTIRDSANISETTRITQYAAGVLTVDDAHALITALQKAVELAVGEVANETPAQPEPAFKVGDRVNVRGEFLTGTITEIRTGKRSGARLYRVEYPFGVDFYTAEALERIEIGAQS